MMSLVLSTEYYGKIRNDLDKKQNANVDTAQGDFYVWHGVEVDSSTRLPVGCDILLNPFELTDSDALVAAEDYVNRLVEAVEVGDISIDTINASVSRILRLKADAGLLSAASVSADDQAATATPTWTRTRACPRCRPPSTTCVPRTRRLIAWPSTRAWVPS